MPKFRRAFSPELKLEAVRQVTEGGRSVPEVAREVGVRPEQLRTWKKQALAAGTVSRPLRVESRRGRGAPAAARARRDAAGAGFPKKSGGEFNQSMQQSSPTFLLAS